VIKNLSYFKGSLIVTVLGLAAGFGIGYIYKGTLSGALTSLFLTFVLAVLEVSLSFDNAVVNAAVLRNMTPVWRHRFLTWGILIAVFGMRIVFPLVIVSVIAHVSPWGALVLAATKPEEYASLMLSSHLVLAGFGGSFLFMVCLRYFFNTEKDVHWIRIIEKPLTQFGKLQAVEMIICLLLFYTLSRFMPDVQNQLSFIVAGIFGLTTFVVVDGLAEMCKLPEEGIVQIHKASAAMFLYLEILDASFSFDGVIGAFALTNNLFIIAAGLGIGAMFVRSLTILLVEKNSLEEFPFIEHGAFYAIGALALLMLLDVFLHVPEALTGLIGAFIIGVSLYSSIRHNRRLAGK
jgi:uncharacterized protein